MVVALGFAPEAREAIEGLGVHALDSDDMIRFVELWDPMKQRTAVASMIYYVEHVERNKALATRLRQFLEGASAAFRAERSAEANNQAD